MTGVGRKHLVIAFSRGDDAPEHEIRVRKTDGKSPDVYGQFTVQTPEAVEERLIRQRHLATLRSVGLRVDVTGTVRRRANELLAALATTVETWGQESPATNGEDGNGTGTG